jgi:peptide/nickel transport system substrate-binding protein
MQDGRAMQLMHALREGRLPRRDFVQRLAALGLAGPPLGALLAAAGAPSAAQAQAQDSAFAYRPTRRGGGGVLRILAWQGATILNPHIANGTKDLLAARLVCEPLATFDRDGELQPILAAEIPTLANGGVARDGLSVTWKLKRGVTWHDGQPFDADDVVFTWEFARHPETAAFTVGTYAPITVRKIDSHTVRVIYERPTPVWSDAYTGAGILPRRHYAAYLGAKAREAPANLKPVGTGPYRIVDFRPGDWVRAEINTSYHMPNRPHFDVVEIKGGGDAVSAARGVLQTGEYDYAPNLQVEDEVLERIERSGRGRIDFAPGGDVEYLMLNQADPWTEREGERSHPDSRHPFLLDPAVRQAVAHLVDRESIQRFIYGRGGVATGNFLNNPAAFNSRRSGIGFDVARAAALLEAGGWKRGSDGVRAKGGQRLKMLFQSSVNTPRQKVQAIIKQAAQQAGIEVELKAVTPSVFFSGDVGNPDTLGKFHADLQMYAVTRAGPDPGRFMELFCSWLAASKANKWLGRNVTRWRNAEYDRLFRATEAELDPVKRAALLVRMNDMVCDDHVVVPIVVRPKVSALAGNLRAPLSGWATETAFIHDWYRV